MKKYLYESYTEYFGGSYHTTTKLYDTTKFNSHFVGCHWDNPAVVASEQVEGLFMSDDMTSIINEYKAESY